MANTEQQIQSLASQVQQLTAQLTSQQQELNNTRTALEQQAEATNAALTVAQSACVPVDSHDAVNNVCGTQTQTAESQVGQSTRIVYRQ